MLSKENKKFCFMLENVRIILHEVGSVGLSIDQHST